MKLLLVETWQARASCRSLGDYLYFAPSSEREHERARRERAAKQICLVCPALLPCRRYALEANEPYGVWGGMSESERRRHRQTDLVPPPTVPPS
ncbi:WhiB family transcriptional regulator [Rhodococcus triatomae]|nr:WhiB family transcriptional regulator [Rhodococcus triatomae BKS 15-14]